MAEAKLIYSVTVAEVTLTQLWKPNIIQAEKTMLKSLHFIGIKAEL